MNVITRRGMPIVVLIALVLTAGRAGGSEDLVYTVQAGDTPCEIAQKFEMSCTVLLEANGLGTDSVIYPGQVLTVTTSGAAPEQPEPEVVPESATTAQDSTSVASVTAAKTDEPATNDSKSDLLAVYQLARAQDPIFAAQTYRYQAALELIPQSKAALRPQLSASGSHTEGTSDTSEATHASIALSQSLYNKGSRIAVNQAGKQVNQAELEFAIASADLVTRVVNVYFSVLAARDNVELSRRNERAIRRQLELAQERLDVGLGTRTDLFDARARFEQAVADTIEAEKLLDDSRQTLVALVGEDVGELETLPDSVALGPPMPDDSEAWVAEALANNFSLKVKSLGISLSDLEIDRQKAQRLPTLGLRLSGNYSDTFTGDDSSARVLFRSTFLFTRAVWWILASGRRRKTSTRPDTIMRRPPAKSGGTPGRLSLESKAGCVALLR